MLSMVYTQTNRYKISSDDLETFYKNIKKLTKTIEYEGKSYLTDGFTLYEVTEFNQMLRGEIYPFPEHVSLKNKKIISNKSIETIHAEIKDMFKRPRIKNNVFE